MSTRSAKTDPWASKTASALAIVLCVALFGAAFAIGHRESGAAQGLPQSQVHDPLPATTAHDWATNADHVVTVHVTFKPPPGRTGFKSTGLAVDDVVWSRPGAVAAPTSLTLATMAVAGTPQFVAGHEYLMAITKFNGTSSFFQGSGGWGPLALSAIFPYDDATIGKGEQVAGASWPSDVRTATQGKSAAALVKLLDAA